MTKELRALALFLSTGVLVPAAAAQNTLAFQVDPSASNWTWSGTTSLGPVLPVTTNQFQMQGTTDMIVTGAALPVSQAEFAGGDILVFPDLAGFVPNPIPGFPPLATIDVTGLHLAITSPPFPVAADGTFTATVTVTALSGQLDVVPLVGTPTSTDLTGTAGAPTAVGGTLTHLAGDMTLDSPQNSTFNFTDPASGISGSFTLVGTLHADWTCPPAVTYCTAKVNSLGCTPSIGWSGGFASWSDPNPFSIEATNVLNLKTGLCFYGIIGPAVIPFQGGTLCTLPPLRRTPIQFSGGSPPSSCTGTHSFDFNAWLQGGNDPNVQVGQRINAQYWTRDPQSSNGTGLTNALDFTVCP